MKPSGVQLASAIVPPGRTTRSSSAAARCVVGCEHRAEHGRDGVEGAVRERQRLGVALEQLDLQALGLGAPPPALEERGDVVDADGGAAVPRRRDGGIAAAGGDVEDAPACLQVGRVAEVLGHEHDPGGDDGEVAACPGRLLPLLDRVEIGNGRIGDGHFSLRVVDRSGPVAGLNRPYGRRSPPSSGAATHLRPRSYLRIPQVDAARCRP